MNYKIVLRITYDYHHPAAAGRHLVRLMPADLPGRQRLVAGLLEISPAPEERWDAMDFFGNATTSFGFRGAHDSIALRVTARVDRASGGGSAPSVRLRDLPADIARVRDLGPGSPLHFLAGSPRAPLDSSMIAYAATAINDSMTAFEAVRAIGLALHRDMKFDSTATTVDTPAAEAFAARRGVCQDFSHIMIASLRGIGIPAGYVSGFLRTRPPKGKPRLEGADAMHAWVRAWCGADTGWIEYDPTNAVLVDTNHIVVAYGRDDFDVSPVKGMLRVSGGQTTDQAVDVIPLDP